MPDIMNAADYAEYEKDVASFIEREKIECLSTSTQELCTECKRVGDHLEDCSEYTDEEPKEGEPWFSWHPCEMCGSHLGGNREYLYARNAEDEIVQFTICEDCVYYVNYGRLDDVTMARVSNDVNRDTLDAVHLMRDIQKTVHSADGWHHLESAMQHQRKNLISL